MNAWALCVALVLGSSSDPPSADPAPETASDEAAESDASEIQDADSEPLAPPRVGQIHQSLFGVEGSDVGYQLDVPDGPDLELKEGSSHAAFVVQDPELRFTFHATRVGQALRIEPGAEKAPEGEDTQAKPAPDDADDDVSLSDVRQVWGRLVYQERIVSFIGLVTRVESDGKRIYALLPLVEVDHALIDGEYEFLRDLIVKRDLRTPGFAERMIPRLQATGKLTDKQATDLMDFVESVRELLRDGNLESAIDNSRS